MAISCRIRKYRKAAQLTQSELAQLLGLRTQGVVSEIESGQRPPSTETALALSAIFDVPVAYLFPGRFGALASDVCRNAQGLQDELVCDAERAAAVAHLAALIRRLGSSPPLP
jgi:transcriptional regulator with XRE-family HTH domain